MITVTDKRTPPAAISTGRPAQAPVDGEMVHVQPTAYYMQGSEHVGPHSKPYPIAKHIATELEGNGFAKIVEPPKPAGDTPPPAGEEGDPDESDEEDESEDEEGEDEADQPDDTSRAPEQGQVTASTVPPTPGAEPQRPASPSPVPPAATSESPQSRRRRGRPPANRG